MKTYLYGPMDYFYEKALKLQFRVGDLDLPERRGIPVVGRTRRKMHRCALVAKQKRVELTGRILKYTKRNGMC